MYGTPMQLKIFALPIFCYACLADLQRSTGVTLKLLVCTSQGKVEGRGANSIFCVYILNGWHHVHTIQYVTVS